MQKSDESRTRRDEQRRKYSKMDTKAKDKLVRSPRENGGGQDTQKIFTQELEGTRKGEDPGKDGKRK